MPTPTQWISTFKWNRVKSKDSFIEGTQDNFQTGANLQKTKYYFFFSSDWKFKKEWNAPVRKLFSKSHLGPWILKMITWVPKLFPNVYQIHEFYSDFPRFVIYIYCVNQIHIATIELLSTHEMPPSLHNDDN